MRALRSIWPCIWFLAAVPAGAGTVEDWNALFLDAVRKETPPPCLVSRNLPIFHLGIHWAVEKAIDQGSGEVDQERCAYLAAERAFRILFPSQQGMVEEMARKHAELLDFSARRLDQELRTIVDSSVEHAFGLREGDGSTSQIHYIPRQGPGEWRRTPPRFRPPELPHWGRVHPFVLDNVANFLAPPPPSLGSDEYAREVARVRDLGAVKSQSRTEEETLIAHFWSDFSYTTSPAGHWNDICREVSRDQGLSTRESARTFAILNVAMADACIAIWHSKYHYNFWRPVTAIRRAAEDGNDATDPDGDWTSLLESPPHPEYPSGHSGVSGAGATVLERLFKDGDLEFGVLSDDVPGVERRFHSFDKCAEEVADSRVFGGIHYPCAGEEGLELGRRVANWVLENWDFEESFRRTSSK